MTTERSLEVVCTNVGVFAWEQESWPHALVTHTRPTDGDLLRRPTAVNWPAALVQSARTVIFATIMNASLPPGPYTPGDAADEADYSQAWEG